MKSSITTENMTARTFHHTFVFLLALASAAFGKEQAARTCRILFLDGPDTAPNTLHLFDGTRSREVELPRMNLSPVYELPLGNLTLSLLPTPSTDPKVLPSGAPTANLNEAVMDFYLLLTSDPSNKIIPVSIQVIDAGINRLKIGQMLWLNLTEHRIDGRLGSEKLVMPPLSTITLGPPADGACDYIVDLNYRITDKEQDYPICETKWLHDPRSRCVAFVFAEPATHTPRVVVFPDFRETSGVRDSP
jgi:hypothetical protein